MVGRHGADYFDSRLSLKPFTLATDTQDNLLVIFRYDPQPGYLVNGKQETVVRLPDDNPMYSGWGNSGWSAWGILLIRITWMLR